MERLSETVGSYGWGRFQDGCCAAGRNDQGGPSQDQVFAGRHPGATPTVGPDSSVRGRCPVIGYQAHSWATDTVSVGRAVVSASLAAIQTARADSIHVADLKRRNGLM